MDEINPLQALIVQLATEGISEGNLHGAVMRAYPGLAQAQYQCVVFGLQEIDRLIGQEVAGEWFLTTIDKSDPDYAHPEYSPEFAEMITAASCGDFVEISGDDLLAQLDAMLEEARAMKPDTGL